MVDGFNFCLSVLMFGVVVLVLGSSRRGAIRVYSWHSIQSATLACDHLPRKMPHTVTV